MLKPVYVHLMNKFPGARVELGEKHTAAFCQQTGELLMRASINGLGVMVDDGLEHGARHALCLSPIPKESRRMKLFKDGRVARAEEFAERDPAARELMKKHGMVPSELQMKHGKKTQTESGVVVTPASPAEALAAEKGL